MRLFRIDKISRLGYSALMVTTKERMMKLGIRVIQGGKSPRYEPPPETSRTTVFYDLLVSGGWQEIDDVLFERNFDVPDRIASMRPDKRICFFVISSDLSSDHVLGLLSLSEYRPLNAVELLRLLRNPAAKLALHKTEIVALGASYRGEDGARVFAPICASAPPHGYTLEVKDADYIWPRGTCFAVFLPQTSDGQWTPDEAA